MRAATQDERDERVCDISGMNTCTLHVHVALSVPTFWRPVRVHSEIVLSELRWSGGWCPGSKAEKSSVPGKFANSEYVPVYSSSTFAPGSTTLEKARARRASGKMVGKKKER